MCSSWTHGCEFRQDRKKKNFATSTKEAKSFFVHFELRTKSCVCEEPPSTLISRRCLLDQNQCRKNCNTTGDETSNLIQESSTACAGISIEACAATKLKLLASHVSSGRWSTWQRNLAWTGARTASSFSCILYVMAGTSSSVKTATSYCIGPKTISAQD